MRLHRALILLGIMILINGFSYAQPPLKIPYQAVIRTPEGEILANQPAVIRTSVILGQTTNDAVFAETHSVTSNPFGVVSLVLGNGTPVTGNFDEINWKAGVAFLKIEIDYQNTGSYTLIGVSQILSVPYALKSGNSLEQLSGQQGQIISHDGSDWQAYDKVWVNPGVVTVDGVPTKNLTDPIFQIKNQAGEVLFTVNSQGVEVKLADSGEEQGSLRVQGLSATEPFLVISPDSALLQFNTDDPKAEKGGFAVGGLSTGKPVSTPYFMLEPALTSLNFDKAAATKAEKGGFAVGGLSTGKTVTSIFTIEQDCTRMYLASELERAEKGGFAVGGLSTGKPLGQEYFRLSSVGAQVTFDEDLQRAEKGGFAVGGLSTGKTVARDYLNLSQEQAKFSMAERDEKSGLGGFTIGGYMDNGEQYTSFFNLNPISVIINTGSITTGEINVGGDINVGGEIIFQPEVSTDYYAEVTDHSALAFGTLYGDGGGAITAFGFVWDTLPTPTVNRFFGQCVLPEVQFTPFWCQLNGLDTAKTYYVRAFATNSAGTAYGMEFEFTTLTGWENKPSVTQPIVVSKTDYSAVFSAEMVNDFETVVNYKGFVVNLTGNPTVSVNDGISMSYNLETGTFEDYIEPLLPDTHYYVRAYVSFIFNDETGVWATYYSPQTTFTTQPSPSVLANQATYISDIYALTEASLQFPENVEADGWGFVWSKTPNPVIDESWTTPYTYYFEPTAGTFSDSLYGLEANTKYYARAYIHQSLYNRYSYGSVFEFTTQPSPTITTNPVADISYYSATISGILTIPSNTQILEGGVIWSNTDPNLTFETSFDFSTENFDVLEPGIISKKIELFLPDTTYYIRTFLRLSDYSSTYGEVRQFRTAKFPGSEITSIDNIGTTSAQINGHLIDPNADVVKYGIVWGTWPDPTPDGENFTENTYSEGITTFSDIATNLQPGTQYYVRSYLTLDFLLFGSSNNINVYSESQTFTTVALPPVVIDTIDATTFYSAEAHATINITDIITSKVGCIWSQNQEFTHASATDSVEMDWGWMGGTFNLELEWLHPGTQYYVKAFIITENYDTLYSASYGFTTQPSPVITNPVDEPTADGAFVTATFRYPGYYWSDFGGFVWGNTADIDTVTHIGSVLMSGLYNEFEHLINGLAAETSYYVKAWAIIDDSIYYGEAQPFTTQSVYGTVTDASDNVYPTKYIGRYSWMLENLRTTDYSYGSSLNANDFRNPASFPDSLAHYGRLYSFDLVTSHLRNEPYMKLCPTGWRLPDSFVWENLVETTGQDRYNAAPYLKDPNSSWFAGAEMNNETEFSARPAGKFVIENPPGSHGDVGQNAYFWSEPYGDENFYTEVRSMSYSDDILDYFMYNSELNPVFISVRCVKTAYSLPKIFTEAWPSATHNAIYYEYMIDETGYSESGQTGLVVSTSPNPTIETNVALSVKPLKREFYREIVEGLEPGTLYFIRAYAINERGTVYTDEFAITTDTVPTVFDNAGNKYPIVTIGDQDWMGANLRTNFYNNGQSINGTWNGYPYYIEPWEYFDLYGMYYQHGVVTDPRGICPNGWEVPRHDDWVELADSLGGYAFAGMKLKNNIVSSSEGGWLEGSNPNTNESGFDALPAGYYDEFQSPMGQTTETRFWGKTQYNQDLGYSYQLRHDTDSVNLLMGQNTNAYSVRCIKSRPGKTYKANVVQHLPYQTSSSTLRVTATIVEEGTAVPTIKGFVYGNNPGITVDNSTFIPADASFTADIPVNLYESIFVKAVVMTAVDTVYSNFESVTIMELSIPTVSLNDVEILSPESVQFLGEITFNGNSPVAQKGFVWGTEENISIEDNQGIHYDTYGPGVTEFSTQVGGFSQGVTYFVKAFATNIMGTSYSDAIQFMTGGFLGQGTTEDPYQIATLDDLIYLSEHSEYWDKHFIQMADIDARETHSMHGGMGYSAIGTQSSPFIGTYNGKGYYIDSLYIDRSAMNHNGLFGHASSAILKNIKLTDATIKGSLFTAGIVGDDNSSSIDSCFVSGTITGNNTHTGGIVGFGNLTTIQNSHFNGTIHGQTHVGGIIGNADGGSVFACSSMADVSGIGGYVGGLIGQANIVANISQNFSAGSAKAPSAAYIGGLIGFANQCTLSNNYTTSKVEANNYSGGLIGCGSGQIYINYCYSAGQVTGISEMGGLTGVGCSGTVYSADGYYDMDATGQNSGPGNGVTNEQMRSISTFVGWDFSDVWTINEGETYPYLRWQGEPGEHNYSTIVKDIDGNVYHTTKIGEQVWFTSNLKTMNLNTGVALEEELSESWQYLTVPGYCYYNNNPSNLITYGALYNWKAVETGSLCPTGWRVSADEDWNDLKSYLVSQGYSENEGEVLKKVGAWDSDLGNPYNFSSIPGGGRDEYGYYRDILTHAIFWTNNAVEPDSAQGILSMNSITTLESFTSHRNNGFSVRCIKNTTKFSGGTGTSEDPYHISTLADLNELANSPDTWNKHFIQNNDIDASASIDYYSGQGWKPIGNDSKPFSGNYNGNGKTISNLTINRVSENNVGLFGYTNAAVIQSLGLVNANIIGTSFIGTLVGQTSNGTQISNCFSSGSVTGFSHSGGFVGLNNNSTIASSYSFATVVVSDYDAGAFVGKNENGGIISNCYSTGSVNCPDKSGGLVGNNLNSTITNCYTTALVTGGVAGGLVGTDDVQQTTTYSYWDLDLSQQNYSYGGTGKSNSQMGMQSTFVGWDFESVWSIEEEVSTPYLQWQTAPALHNFSILLSDVDGNKYKTVKIGEQVWMAENLRVTNYNTGGAIYEVTDGSEWSTHISPVMCYYENVPSNADTLGVLYNGYGMTTTDICPWGWHVPSDVEWGLLETYLADNNFSGSQGMALKSKSWGGTDNFGFNALPAGWRDSDGTYMGLTTEVKFWTSTLVGESGVARLLLSANAEIQTGNPLRQMGGYVRCIKNTTKFTDGDGTVGNPYQISNMNDLNELTQSPSTWDKNFIQMNDIDASATLEYFNGGGWMPIGRDNSGFSGVYDGNYKTINLMYMFNPDPESYDQGFFGFVSNATIKNLGVNNSNFTGGWSVGSLAGYAVESTIENCYSINGNVNGQGSVGGLLGSTYKSIISKSFSANNVTGIESASGFLGDSYQDTIINCYNRGSVASDSIVSGFAMVEKGTVINCYSAPTVASGQVIGGFTGKTYPEDTPIVKFSFYDYQLSEVSSNFGGMAKQTSEMKDSATFIQAGWDFKGWGGAGIWNIGHGQNEGYPYLDWEHPTDLGTTPFNLTPGVYTYKPENSTTTSAVFVGEIPFLGSTTPATQHGFCWNTSGFPTTSDDNLELGTPVAGLFSGFIGGLTFNTKYYIRAFATNAIGTAYGEEIEFFTLPIEPVAPAMGDGSPGNPYQIANLENLFWVTRNLPATGMEYIHCIQTDNINASETSTWYNGAGWPVIGTSLNKPYQGYYKGKQHIISNLHINRPDADHPVGLFGWPNNTLIDSLGLENVNITGKDNVGAFIGHTWNSCEVNQCYVTGIVNGQNCVGALVGHNRDSRVYDSYSVAEVVGTDTVGGLVGFNNSYEMTTGYCAGKVTGSYSVGGIAGARMADQPTNNICFWDSVATTQLTSAEGQGHSTSEMLIKTTYSNWDFETVPIWGILGSETYPYLMWQNGPAEFNTPSIVKDIDGNTYKTVKIGTQVWMAENLKVTKYNTGNPITEELNGPVWIGLTEGAHCYYNMLPENLTTYGRLYNWYAVETGNLCPIGWNVPTSDEYNVLLNTYGTSFAGGALKETGTSHWQDPNTGANNSSGFTALPGGMRETGNGDFTGIIENAYFWSSTPYQFDPEYIVSYNIVYNDPQIYSNNMSKKTGFSVRCIKNAQKFSGGTGTELEPYIINTLADLNELAQSPGTWDKHFRQEATINAKATENWYLGYGWKPIGTTTNHFTGTYNGNGHSIDSLYINRSEDPHVGLFGYTRLATFKNLTINAMQVQGTSNVGTLAGETNGGLVENCHVQTDLVAPGNFIGGLIGRVSQGTTITQSSSSGTVNGGAYVGGLVGYSSSSNISQSYSAVEVSASVNGIGGFVGNVDGTSIISDSYATGSVSGENDWIGGFAGHADAASLVNCFSTGSVLGSYNVGGLVAVVEVGFSFTSSYWDTESSGQPASAGGTGKTNLEMSQQATFVDWDFDSVWSIDEEISTPWLQWQTAPGKQNFTRFVTDIEGNRYKIAKIGSQVWMRENLRANKLNNGTDIALVEDNSAWGSASTPAYCYWDNNPANKPDNGALYNGFAVSTGNLCPVGWHVPTQADWETLNTFISANYSAQEGEALKITTSFSSYLDDPYGFSALPAGYRSTGGDFYGDAYFWTSTEFSPDVLYYHYLQMWVPTLEQGQISSEAGYSVRCIRNETKFSGGDGSVLNPYKINTLNDLNELAQSPETWEKNFEQTDNIDAEDAQNWHNGAGWLPIGNETTPFRGFYSGSGYTISNLYMNRSDVIVTGFFGVCDNTLLYDIQLTNLNFTAGSTMGGLIGMIRNFSIVHRCATSGIMEGVGFLGGIVGYCANSQISETFSTVNINGGGTDIGGLAGKIEFSSEINNCYSMGDIYGGDYFGGLVGRNESSTISNSYSVGWVSQNGTCGGLVGVSNGTVTNSFWDTETSGQATSAEGVGKSTAEMKAYSTFFGNSWDFDGVWGINATDNEGYPFLKWQGYTQQLFSGGVGTTEEPYIINTFEDFVSLTYNFALWNKEFSQTAEIDLERTGDMNDYKGLMPIGNSTYPFTGVYNGNNQLLRETFMNQPTADTMGVFGFTQGATLKNIVLSASSITGKENTGALIGYANSTTVDSCLVNGTTATGTNYVGGLVGKAINNTTISNCGVTNAAVYGDITVGGLVGLAEQITIQNSYSAANVTANLHTAGGLVGLSQSTTTISNCYATGAVTANNHVGAGLVGFADATLITNCYCTGAIYVGSNYGGMIASIGGNGNTITNSFWNKTTSDINTSEGGTGYVNIKFGKQKTFTGWDFTNIWAIDEFVTYPYLQWQGSPGEHNNPPDEWPLIYVEDADGNKYGTINIGGYVWMDENLRTTKYDSEVPIPEVTDNAAWNALTTGAFCWYNNNAANANTYGALYNFYAIDPATNGGNQLCPSGWHAATETDWSNLMTELVSYEFSGNEGTALKAQTGWGAGNGTDYFGFEAYPGGLREASGGTFTSAGSEAFWWGSDLGGSDASYMRISGSGYMTNADDKYTGRSVRCVQDY